MHWCYGVSEALRKDGDATDAIVVLDPNFPAWCNMDRCVDWLGPAMNKALGIPMCLIKNVIGPSFFGKMRKQAQWQTLAIREKTTSSSIARASNPHVSWPPARAKC